MPELQFGEVFANIDLFLEACGLTLALWAVALAAGLSGGLLVGLARLSPRRWIAWPARGYVELFRNTPVLVQLIWFYYALPVLSGIQLPAFAAAALALSLNASAYCAEIYRGGIQSVAAGQWEAGRALGMGRLRLLRRIILPLAVRRMVPAFTNRAVELAKNTSVASIITVHELMYTARLFSSQNYIPMETFTVVAMIYFLLIYPFTLASYALERRFAAGRA
ncbi:amino acid ABC transporter permease [Azospirillum sp. YIM B02556]|uniref:Amino acid ABC transporter permease n=2 Tax=Azospirillum endophyticum TaxID=2800326 RepID=A0ABS1EXV9_9PROT|nr:amino acid ABC transporter permease [Azospirillum endophyticum]